MQKVTALGGQVRADTVDTFARSAVAHVRYVTDADNPAVAVAEFFAFVFSNPVNVLLLLGGAVAAVGVATGYLLYADRVADIAVARRTLQSYMPYLPWLLRLAIGLPLVGAGFSGYYFAPPVAVEARLLQVVIGFCLLFGLATRAVALLGVGAYLVGVVQHPALLLASEYVAGFLAILIVGPGQPSADMLFRRLVVTDGTVAGAVDARIGAPIRALRHIIPDRSFAPVFIRGFLGFNFAYLGVTQKWLNPGQALAVVAKYDLTSIVPVAPELWVFGAGLVELGVGLLLLGGVFTRGVAGVAFLLLTTTLLGLPDDPVLAHISLFGLTSALMITGSGPFALDTNAVPRLRASIRRSTGVASADR